MITTRHRIYTLGFVLALSASWLHATAENKLPAPKPEFLNSEQLAEWRAKKTAEFETKKAQEVQMRSVEAEVFYTGKPYIEDSGTYAFLFRSYDPELARWTSADPSGFPDGANNIVYSGNPLIGIDPDGLAWSNWDFVHHYYFGGGTAVDLAQIGHLSGVQSAANVYTIGGASRFRIQIKSDAQGRADANGGYTGNLTNSFSNNYDFRSVIYSLGSGTLSGSFAGVMTSTDHAVGTGGIFEYNEGGYLAGDMTVITFQDSFTDPTGVIQAITGSSNPPGAPSWWENIANLGGTAYPIIGSWTENYQGWGSYE